MWRWPEDGVFISGMGLDFRDFNNDGFPDIAYVALKNQTFPIYLNTGKGDFVEVTASSGMRAPSLRHGGLRRGALRLRQRWLEGPVRHPRARLRDVTAGQQIRATEHRLSQPGRQREMAAR